MTPDTLREILNGKLVDLGCDAHITGIEAGCGIFSGYSPDEHAVAGRWACSISSTGKKYFCFGMPKPEWDAMEANSEQCNFWIADLAAAIKSAHTPV